jgi:hypothetical protein
MQRNMLKKSKALYKRQQYYTRKKVNSFHSKPSQHVKNAMQLYHLNNVLPSRKLSRATGCSVNALSRIVKKGEGAYYSSGSRPNQTAQSWGIARLASAITGGKSAAVDFHILEKGCQHNKTAYRLAKQSRKKYKYGQGHTRRVWI